MRTREKSYKDHGFENDDEAKKVIEYCRSPDFGFERELITSAISANKLIAYDLFYSIVCDLSYREIEKIKYIPINEVDFYAYRRMCLGIMYNWLKMNNITF